MTKSAMTLLFAAATLAALGDARDPPPAQPAMPGSMDDLPGNRQCVSCHFAAGLVIVGVEIAVLYGVTSGVANCLTAKVARGSTVPDQPLQGAARSLTLHVLRLTGSGVGKLIAAMSYVFFLTYFAVYWNFISYAMLSGPILVMPSIIASYVRSPTPAVRDALLARRLKLAGWLLGVMMLALFPNVSLFTQQVERHFDPSWATITPNDPLVLALRDKFYAEIPASQYAAMPFATRMAAVDEFIFEQITWKDDYHQYGMIGLLTSPADVLTRGAGDCQGQSAVTTSLLFALGGTQAYCVETPFHWWTHAVDDETGETYNLNSHGGAALKGSVLPQPVDMVYTWYPPSCDNCSDVEAYNRNTMFFVAPPSQALMIAFTGMHEFRRDILPPFVGKEWELGLIGGVVALVLGVYASYFQHDLTNALSSSDGFWRLAKRATVVAPATVYTMVMMLAWGYLYYNVVLIHIVGLLTFAMSYVCGDAFNIAIGTPPPPPSKAMMPCCASARAPYEAVPSSAVAGAAARYVWE